MPESPLVRVHRSGLPLRACILAASVALAGCTGEGHGPRQLVRVPRGASFAQVADSLSAHDIVRAPFLFEIYARLTGAASQVKPGTYGFRAGEGWRPVLADLRSGRVLTVRLVIPEGWTLDRIAPRLARITDLDADSIQQVLEDTSAAQRLGVPGPTLEGYLYPATYTWPLGTSLDTMVATLVRRFREVWTPTRRALADSLDLSERDVVTLASIVQAETRLPQEMPIIAGVYRNRLRIGMALQADPTVQYALQHHRARLLYTDIAAVAGNPYNTYTHPGLPPGPIGSPGEQAIEAVLHPARVDYLYFVARPDGTDIFSRTLAEHNRARARVRAMLAAESAAAHTARGGSPARNKADPDSGTSRTR